MPISYSTGEKRSFGWVTARERWPVIITQAIDDLYRSVSDSEEGEKKTEGKAVTEKIARLKYEVQHDRPLTPIDDDGEPDVKLYNDELASLGEPTWLDTPWLFCECYLFRRISTYFKLSTHWKNYDVFARQKINTFRSSRPAVLELAARFKELVQQLEANGSATQDEAAEKLLFAEMCEICLWGNATDLSLLTSLTYEDIQKLQGSEARKASEKNILANDLPAAYAVLKQAVAEGKKERRVDIVLDNAGFELYVDLILAGYLLSAGLATHIVLHPKSIPCELVVFKGDLNYRKLTGDADWDPTTPFPDAIKTLGPGSGLNVLALRTCKADVVVGLPAGKDEELRALEGGGGDSGARKWAWNGKWAVVSFSQGK
ncbi:hypothetical protein VdG1_03639 [Verticillium dahliae VDG1]|nr:hypothetical protein VdG1_03639 [Verticillium dahliae VDG1]